MNVLVLHCNIYMVYTCVVIYLCLGETLLQFQSPFPFHLYMQVISSPGPDRYSSSRATPSIGRFPSSLPSPLSSALVQALSLTGGRTTPGGVAGLTSSLITSIDGRSRQGLKEAAVQYCLRIIDQCERSMSHFLDKYGWKILCEKIMII